MTGPTRRDALRLCIAAAVAAAGPTAVSAAGRTFRVTIKALAFGPTPPQLRVGDTVEWVNADIFRHTATARNGSFDVDLAPGERARTIIRSAGEAPFYCRYHPNMVGTLRVKP